MKAQSEMKMKSGPKGWLWALFLPWFFMAVMGCVTRAPVPESAKTDNSLRQWVAKAEFFDKAKDRKHTLDMDFLALGQQKLRLDVSGSFAVSLAAAVMSGDQMTCLLPRQKRFYQGTASEAALRTAMQIPLDPHWILMGLKDQELKNWKCEKGGDGQVQRCVENTGATTVTWSERSQDYKKVLIQSAKYELELKLREVQTKVQDIDKAFTIKIPSDYTAIKVR